LVAFVLLIFMASACKTVPASQRGTLLEPCMQPPSDPMEIALDSHVHESREAIVGGTAVGGPSCGCN
jgi:hypothetical protein